MTAEALKNIYHNPEDPGSYGGVDRLLKLALELKIPGANRKVVEEFLRGRTSLNS